MGTRLHVAACKTEVELVHTLRCAHLLTSAGYVGITQQQCEDKGCCWQPAEVSINEEQEFLRGFLTRLLT